MSLHKSKLMEKPYFLILVAGIAFYCIRCTSLKHEYNEPEVQSVVSVGKPVAFPNTQIETSASRILFISNTGNKPFTITGITSSHAAFTVPESEKETVAPGGSVGVQVQFAPDREQDYSATLTVESDADQGEGVIQITGMGVDYHKSVISLTGEPAFGEVEAGKSARKLIKIANTGNEPFDIINITSSDPAFSLLNAARNTLAPGSTREVEIQFSPTEEKNYSATITIENNADQGKNTMQATGTGIKYKSVIAVSGRLDFGRVEVGKSVRKQLVIANKGNKSFDVSGLTFPADVYTSAWGGGTLAPGGSVSIVVVFKPTAAGTFNGTLTVNHNADAGEYSLPVTGSSIVSSQ